MESKIKTLLLSIIFLIVFSFFLYKTLNHSDVKNYNEKIIQNKELVNNGEKTKVKFANTYSKLIRKSDEFYYIDFTYSANKKIYKNSIQAPSTEILVKEIQNSTITYNKKNPEIYSFTPEEDVKYYSELLSKYDDSFPWFFLLMFLVSIYGIIYSILGIKEIKREELEMNEY